MSVRQLFTTKTKKELEVLLVQARSELKVLELTKPDTEEHLQCLTKVKDLEFAVSQADNIQNKEELTHQLKVAQVNLVRAQGDLELLSTTSPDSPAIQSLEDEIKDVKADISKLEKKLNIGFVKKQIMLKNAKQYIEKERTGDTSDWLKKPQNRREAVQASAQMMAEVNAKLAVEEKKHAEETQRLALQHKQNLVAKQKALDAEAEALRLQMSAQLEAEKHRAVQQKEEAEAHRRAAEEAAKELERQRSELLQQQQEIEEAKRQADAEKARYAAQLELEKQQLEEDAMRQQEEALEEQKKLLEEEKKRVLEDTKRKQAEILAVLKAEEEAKLKVYIEEQKRIAEDERRKREETIKEHEKKLAQERALNEAIALERARLQAESDAALAEKLAAIQRQQEKMEERARSRDEALKKDLQALRSHTSNLRGGGGSGEVHNHVTHVHGGNGDNALNDVRTDVPTGPIPPVRFKIEAGRASKGDLRHIRVQFVGPLGGPHTPRPQAVRVQTIRGDLSGTYHVSIQVRRLGIYEVHFFLYGKESPISPFLFLMMEDNRTGKVMHKWLTQDEDGSIRERSSGRLTCDPKKVRDEAERRRQRDLFQAQNAQSFKMTKKGAAQHKKFLSQFIALAQVGAIFNKHPTGTFGKPRKVRVVLTGTVKDGAIQWGRGKMVKLETIQQIVLGKRQNKHFEQAQAPDEECLTIVTPKRVLNLQAQNRQERDTWAEGLVNLLNVELVQNE